MGTFSLCFVSVFFYNSFIYNILCMSGSLEGARNGLVSVFKALLNNELRKADYFFYFLEKLVCLPSKMLYLR